MQTARRVVPLQGRARHEPVTALRFDLQGVHSIGNRLHSSLSIHLRLLIRCRILCILLSLILALLLLFSLETSA
jgi:hypothetical protein